MLVFYHLQLLWCWCPAEKVGKVHPWPKCASSSRVGETGIAVWQAATPCQWGEPAAKHQDVWAERAPGASSQASYYESNMDAASDCTQTSLMAYHNQNI